MICSDNISVTQTSNFTTFAHCTFHTGFISSSISTYVYTKAIQRTVQGVDHISAFHRTSIPGTVAAYTQAESECAWKHAEVQENMQTHTAKQKDYVCY